MVGLFLNPVVLCVLVWMVARGSAEIDFWQMFFIALGVGIFGTVLGLLVGGGLFALLALLPVLALLVFLLMRFCCLTLQQALIVSGLYLVYEIVLAVLFQGLLA